MPFVGSWTAPRFDRTPALAGRPSGPTIKALYVFGSYAEAWRGRIPILILLSILATRMRRYPNWAAVWKAELSQLTDILIKDVYLSTDMAAQGP
jgi:hypothetical protein